MIDFVKITFYDKYRIENHVTNPDNFKECYSIIEQNSGEILYPKKVYEKKMEVSITKKTACLRNSIHKMANYIEHGKADNYNDFGYNRLCKTIDYLNDKFLLSRHDKITQLEFGLNIKTLIPAQDIVSNNIIYHKYKTHSVNRYFNGKGCLKQFNHSNYNIKVYDKAKQNNLNANILRFEIKYKGNKVIKSLGGYNLFDLKDKEVLRTLFRDLLKRFDELTIIDEIPDEVSKKDRKEIQMYLSFNYWENLSERKNRNRKAIHIKRFNKLLEKNDLLKTHKFLRNSLIQKFKNLIDN